MKARARLLAAALCILAFAQRAALFAADASTAGPSSQAGPVAPAAGREREGFSREGPDDVSVASGAGSSAEEAEELARGAALRGLFEGLGKDRLFAEVFTAAPPLSLSIQLVSASREGLGYKALVRLQIDDESVGIIERGPYLAAAVGILDKAEAQSDEAEARRAGAVAAETRAELGTALGQYGMAIDACRGALELVGPVADPTLFSTKGKRTAPELKKNLSSILAESSAGVERVKKAEADLAADESSVAATGVADAAIAEADKAQALLDELAPALGNVSAYGEEKLSPMRDRIASERRGLGDSKAALERARAALPRDKTSKGSSAAEAKGPSFASANEPSFAKDKLDFAGRRLDTAEDSLAAAFHTVDREMRDPAARRAARAQAIRWAFLHEPREYVSLRTYLPFSISAGKEGLSGSPFDFAGDFEGAFAFGGGGVWARSQIELATTDLTPGVAGGDEHAFSQSFDFGVWRKSLFFVGYQWDWLRQVDGGSYPEVGAAEIGIGGVYEHGPSTDRFRRADWLVSLSYQIPYAMEEFELQNILNLGLGATFRLGNLALLEASVSKRLDDDYSVLSWAIGLGVRLPPPFAIGFQFFGAYPQLLKPDGSLGPATNFDGGHFRFYLQYSI